MKIIVGSKNPNKVEAVREAFGSFKEFRDIEIVSLSADSGVGEQPKTMEDTVNGAMNRARNAFIDCDLSVGIESGIFKVPNTKSGYMDSTICALFDGKNYHLGGSPTFEYPKSMVDLVLNEGHDISQAAKKIGLTNNSDVGDAEGIIGILSNGVLDRKSYTKPAVITAIIHLLHPDHY